MTLGGGHLQENTHRLTLSMSPDESYFVKRAEAEELKLKQATEALSESDKEETYQKGTAISCSE